MRSVTSSFFNIVTTKVSDGKSIKIIELAADFYFVAVLSKVIDRKSVKSLAVAVDSFHVFTIGMGD